MIVWISSLPLLFLSLLYSRQFQFWTPFLVLLSIQVNSAENRKTTNVYMYISIWMHNIIHVFACTCSLMIWKVLYIHISVCIGACTVYCLSVSTCTVYVYVQFTCIYLKSGNFHTCSTCSLIFIASRSNWGTVCLS